LGGVNTMVKGHMQGRMSYEEAVARSLNAGCDFSDNEYMRYIPAAVRQGLLPESRLNDALYRVLHDRIRLGEFDPPEMVPFSRIPPEVICSPAHRQLALQTARESIVLLKNDGHVLPLDRQHLRRIAVIGPHAALFTPGGYSGKADRPSTPLQGVKNLVGPGTEVLYAKGCEIGAPPLRRAGSTNALASINDESSMIQQAASTAREAEVAIVCVGTTEAIESEGRDRTTLGLPDRHIELIQGP
jgi:beta-glucosidase